MKQSVDKPRSLRRVTAVATLMAFGVAGCSSPPPLTYEATTLEMVGDAENRPIGDVRLPVYEVMVYTGDQDPWEVYGRYQPSLADVASDPYILRFNSIECDSGDTISPASIEPGAQLAFAVERQHVGASPRVIDASRIRVDCGGVDRSPESVDLSPQVMTGTATATP